jgi:hypothetical protein
MAAAPGPAAPPITAPPALSPPAVPHVFTRVTLPGEDNTLDYVAVSAATAVVRGLPLLGWVDSSAVQANTRAAPLLSVAGCVCLSTYVEDKSSPVGRALLALSELLAVPTLVLLGRCADACESLRMFAVPLTNYDDWVDKLKPALARIPHPSPFILGGGELVEANAFATPAIPAVAAVAAIAAVPAVRRIQDPAGEAAAARPLTAPDLTPLTAANCDGRRVLVPAHVWPSYSCDEHAGRGWEAVVLRHSQRAATVRFLHAATARGIPYEDAQLQLTVLNPI